MVPVLVEVFLSGLLIWAVLMVLVQLGVILKRLNEIDDLNEEDDDKRD